MLVLVLLTAMSMNLRLLQQNSRLCENTGCSWYQSEKLTQIYLKQQSTPERWSLQVFNMLESSSSHQHKEQFSQQRRRCVRNEIAQMVIRVVIRVIDASEYALYDSVLEEVETKHLNARFRNSTSGTQRTYGGKQIRTTRFFR